MLLAGRVATPRSEGGRSDSDIGNRVGQRCGAIDGLLELIPAAVPDEFGGVFAIGQPDVT